MSNKNMVSWFEIYVSDMARAQKFYETVVGTKMIELPAPEGSGMTMVAFPWFEGVPNAAGMLVKSEMGKPSATGTIVYFDSEDCDTELRRVEQAGGKVLLPKTSAGEYGFFCQFSDTEGNTLGFFSKK